MEPVSDQAVPERVLKWVVDSVGGLAEVESVRRLYGGMSSAVHCISLRTRGLAKDYVIRQFDNAEWLREEPDLALHEAESLRRAFRSGLPTPQVVAFDETGRDCGVPAVLMTRLEGTVVLRPRLMSSWLDGLAESLARIHAVEAGNFPWVYFTYRDIASLEIPSWSRVPGLWDQAISRVRGPRPEYEPRFIHRDYHPTNILWARGAVSGVVDWVNACRGPSGIDVGHCRVNLAMLFGVSAADAFLAAYERHAGPSFSYDSYWDLLSLIDILFGPPVVYPGWTALGVTGLTDQRMMERLDAYLKSLLNRASKM